MVSSLGEFWGWSKVRDERGRCRGLGKDGIEKRCFEVYVLGRIRGRKISPAPREDQPKRSCTRSGRTASQAVMRMA